MRRKHNLLSISLYVNFFVKVLRLPGQKKTYGERHHIYIQLTAVQPITREKEKKDLIRLHDTAAHLRRIHASSIEAEVLCVPYPVRGVRQGGTPRREKSPPCYFEYERPPCLTRNDCNTRSVLQCRYPFHNGGVSLLIGEKVHQSIKWDTNAALEYARPMMSTVRIPPAARIIKYGELFSFVFSYSNDEN